MVEACNREHAQEVQGNRHADGNPTPSNPEYPQATAVEDDVRCPTHGVGSLLAWFTGLGVEYSRVDQARQGPEDVRPASRAGCAVTLL